MPLCAIMTLSGLLDSHQDNNQHGFRLCIHDSDFIGGYYILENIVRAIECSKKTILILTKNFLESIWCEFELQMATAHSLTKGRSMVIAVVLEELPLTLMSSDLMKQTCHNGYIKWSDNLAEQEEFWSQLREALGDPGPTLSAC